MNRDNSGTYRYVLSVKSPDKSGKFLRNRLAAIVQMLNAVGALTLVYALRYGKAIIVVPITGLAPVITVVISLIV